MSESERPPLADDDPGRPSFLQGRFVVLLAAVISVSLVWYAWGWWNPPPIVADEAAYLLQARIFATGHWTGPARPFAEFFDQMHVFSRPILASKYPPGESLLMVPGIWIGFAPLAPLLCIAVIGGGTFSLARRLAGPGPALLAWAIWLSAPAVRIIGSTYLSETTTGALWLLAWAMLIRWKDKGGAGSLSLLAVFLAWGVITRPFTMVAFSIPVLIQVVRLARRRRSGRQLAIAALAGTAVIGIVPLWNLFTLGTVRQTPYAYYSRTFFPYDKPGFGLGLERPLAALPFGGAAYDRANRSLHALHTVASLPRAALARIANLWSITSGDRVGLVVLFVAGLFVLPREGWLALATVGLLILFYLPMAHPPEWSVYYFEAVPVLALVCGCGTYVVLRALVGWLRRSGFMSRKNWEIGLSAAASALFVVGGLPRLERFRLARREETAERQALLNFARSGTSPRSIVFVPCTPQDPLECELVANGPDLAHARVWVVHDLGPRDRKLIACAPDRLPLLLGADQKLHTMSEFVKRRPTPVAR